MLIKESQWIGKNMSAVDSSSLFPLLNLGSSTKAYRKDQQPWNEEYIFSPFRGKNQKIINVDFKNEEGIDIVGDLTDSHFLKKLSGIKFNSILCTNLLEHLEKKEALCNWITNTIPKGGYLFISCPNKIMPHGNPVDTMFRPNIEELQSLFPTMKKVQTEIITDYTYATYLSKNRFGLLKYAIKLLLPFYQPKNWITYVRLIPWIFKKFRVTCLVLKKT
ncbi:MAG: methyltransferase type 11 [Candidatus Woesearchaeota archaeon]|mgnify:CR=1 FL=1|jgi:hypothetical protein|nr:methyltransferase type 11 [Candidatus Woesearchaeota archaeon]